MIYEIEKWISDFKSDSLKECIDEYSGLGVLSIYVIIMSVFFAFYKKSILIGIIVFFIAGFISIVFLPFLSKILRFKYFAIIYRFFIKYLSFPIFILILLSSNFNIHNLIIIIFIYINLLVLYKLILLDNFEFDDYIPCSEVLKSKSLKTVSSFTKKTVKTKKRTTKKKKRKNYVICANCGHKVENPTSNICPYCGNDLYKKRTNMIKCPVCGNEYDEKESKCPYCGASKP